MNDITILHNPRCRKSRETLEFLKTKGIEPTIIEYLKAPISKRQLTSIVEKLGIPASELLRTEENLYKERYKSLKLNDTVAIDLMFKHPELIQRPVVIKGDKAVIGRPPEKVLELI